MFHLIVICYYNDELCLIETVTLSILKTYPKSLKKSHTAQKMKLSIKDFFSKCDQIRRKLSKETIFLKL